MRDPAEKCLLLFDIDGTLLTSGGAGEEALKDAMRARFGAEEDFQNISLAGATDSGIARHLLAKHGIADSPENLATLLDAYLEALHGRMPRHPGSLLPGIIELLDRLAALPWCVTALLTGNIAKGAQIKLTHYGVWHYFEFGAYGCDHHDRNELGHFAMARASERHGISFAPEHIAVIGDTPRDIECGRAIGARTVAIATGSHTAAELESHQPDLLFADLSDTDAVLAALLAVVGKDEGKS